jgi:hypothetical protein
MTTLRSLKYSKLIGQITAEKNEAQQTNLNDILVKLYKPTAIFAIKRILTETDVA